MASIYNGGSDGGCTGIEIIKIKLSDPNDAVTLRRADAQRQCHDNTIPAELAAAGGLRVR